MSTIVGGHYQHTLWTVSAGRPDAYLLIDPLSEGVQGIIGDGSPGICPGKLDDPEGVAISGNSDYFADSDNNRIIKYVVLMNLHGASTHRASY